MGIAPTIAFLDIPYTSDEPVSSTLAAAGIQDQEIRNGGNYLRNPGKTERRLAKYAEGWERWTNRGGRVTIGQVPYAVYERHLPAEIRYVTFMRDPVDRVLAHRESMQSPDSPPELNNLATRFLIDDPDSLGELSADALAEAKANLRRFALVGIQERFEESVVLLGGLLEPEAGQAPGAQPDAQPAPKGADDRQSEAIAESNSLDIELYSFACDLLDQALAGREREVVTPPPDTEPPPRAYRLSLETVSAEDLRGLGMSVTQTKRVLAYREKYGFTSFDQLDEVPGFPRQQLTEIKRRLSA